jgi:3-oxoacyl-[acyl-carrier protein] reductase
MGDWLLEVGKNPTSRRLLGNLGLPLALPQTLARANGPWEQRPFAEKLAIVGGTGPSALLAVIVKALVEGGADARIANSHALQQHQLGEALSRATAPIDLATLSGGLQSQLAVFDASAIDEPAGVRALYDFFHAVVPSLASSAHVVVVGRPTSEATSAFDAATRGDAPRTGLALLLVGTISLRDRSNDRDSRSPAGAARQRDG